MRCLTMRANARPALDALLPAGLLSGLLLCLLVPASRAAADIGAERKDELLYLLKHDCGSCHGMTLKGGLGAPLLPSLLAGKSDEDLVSVILDGVPSTPMPPWRPFINQAEAKWLVGVLRRGEE